MTVAMIAVVIGLIRLAWMLMTRDSRPNEENAPPLIPKRPDAVPPSRAFPASEPVRFEPDLIPAPRKPVPRFEYIYGFVGGNPQRHSGDLQGFAGLNQLLFSGTGGVTIGASLHPYQAMGADANIWRQCLDYIRSSRCTDLDALAREEAVYHMNPPQQILYRHCEDRRLLPEANPTYGKYVPFLIPYVSFSEKELTFGEEQIAVDFAQHGHATAFLEKLEVALHFLFSSGNAAVVPSQLSKEEALAFLGHNMPIGFGIYVPGQESAVIDAFETVRTKFLETLD